MRQGAPHLKFVFHDSFHKTPADWDDLFDDDDIENVVVDTHYYRAWNSDNDSVDAVCAAYKEQMEMLAGHKYDVLVGEWSLATDDCALWLGNFNDGGAGDSCQWVDCPYSYLKGDLAVDFDRDAAFQGPFGTDPDLIKYGKCPFDSAKSSHEEVAKMGECIHEYFDANIQAHTMWTFRNELETRWAYLKAYEQGLIPSTTTYSGENTTVVQNN